MVDAVLAIGFDEIGLHRIDLGVFDFNTRAIRCYEKCGFVQEGLAREALPGWRRKLLGHGVYGYPRARMEGKARRSMKPFLELTGRGQVQRLKKLAIRVLDSHDLGVVRMSPLVHYNNATFRLQDRQGNNFVMRINRPFFHSKAEIESEIRWMSALQADLEIATPQVVSARDGSLSVKATVDGVPHTRDVVVFKWVSGRLQRRLPLPYLYRAGKTLARIHAHGVKWRKPSKFVRKTWEPDMMLYG